MRTCVFLGALSLAVFFAHSVSAQHLSYRELKEMKKRYKGTVQSYTSEARHTYKLGDTLVIGTPNRTDDHFQYIWWGGGDRVSREIQSYTMPIDRFQLRRSGARGFYILAWVPTGNLFWGDSFYRIDL